MLKIIYGKKGTGKSQQLVDAANSEVKTAKGDILYIDDSSRRMYELKHEIRFVDTTEYGMDSLDKLYGLICGMLASNYDVSAIYIDSIKGVTDKNLDINSAESFINRLEEVTKDINFVMVITGIPENCPEFIKNHLG